MQARFTVDARELDGREQEDVTLNVFLEYTGEITAEITVSTEIDWDAVVSAVESDGMVSFGGFDNDGGFEVESGMVKIVSPYNGDGSMVSVTVPAALCIDAFKRIRDVTAEFAADPVEFARRFYQQGE